MGLSPIPFVMVSEVSPAYVSPIEQLEHIGQLNYETGRHSYISRNYWLMLNYKDNEFLCRACFPFNTQFSIRRRYVEGGQSVLHFRCHSIIVDVVLVQNVQIIGV